MSGQFTAHRGEALDGGGSDPVFFRERANLDDDGFTLGRWGFNRFDVRLVRQPFSDGDLIVADFHAVLDQLARDFLPGFFTGFLVLFVKCHLPPFAGAILRQREDSAASEQGCEMHQVFFGNVHCMDFVRLRRVHVRPQKFFRDYFTFIGPTLKRTVDMSEIRLLDSQCPNLTINVLFCDTLKPDCRPQPDAFGNGPSSRFADVFRNVVDAIPRNDFDIDAPEAALFSVR